MNKADQEFIREYCEKYGVETTPGPGVPCLNGVPLVGEALRQLFMPAGRVDEPFFYGLGEIKLSKKPKNKAAMPSGEAVAVSYGRASWTGWNGLQMDKLVS